LQLLIYNLRDVFQLVLAQILNTGQVFAAEIVGFALHFISFICCFPHCLGLV